MRSTESVPLPRWFLPDRRHKLFNRSHKFRIKKRGLHSRSSFHAFNRSYLAKDDIRDAEARHTERNTRG